MGERVLTREEIAALVDELMVRAAWYCVRSDLLWALRVILCKRQLEQLQAVASVMRLSEVSLDADAQRALHENLWELYTSDRTR